MALADGIHSLEKISDLHRMRHGHDGFGKITFRWAGRLRSLQNILREDLPNWHTDERGGRELRDLVDQIKAVGKGREFDCIIGMSGGIDSSYLTYVASRVGTCGRWCSTSMRAGTRRRPSTTSRSWSTSWGWISTRKSSIGARCVICSSHSSRRGVPHIDTPQDHAFFATMYKFAEQTRLRYILTGANLSTECIRNPIEWMYYQSDSIQLRDIHRRFGTRPLTSFPLTRSCATRSGCRTSSGSGLCGR